MQFQRNDKNVLPSLRQRAGPQRNYSRQKSIRSSTARDSFSQTPHTRGKVQSFSPPLSEWGSPPHMRGKAFLRQCRNCRIGITPACAGKSLRRCEKCLPLSNHPRMCGEKFLSKAPFSGVLGSPPHVRGKAECRCFPFPVGRITPAYAGKRKKRSFLSRIAQDHPRVCGEKYRIFLCRPLCGGSPPRMRGKVTLQDVQRFAVRITPAYAGKSHRH